MNLAIFDVDGTLLFTDGADKRCFLRALELTFDISGIDPEWSHYANVSDPGLAGEISARHRGRAMHPDEEHLVQRRYLDLLAGEHARDPSRFREAPGSSRALRTLAAHPDWALAIATGGWRRVALRKLELAGLPVDGLIDALPMASGEDGPERVTILRAAVTLARARYAVEQFPKVVSVGDAEWDTRAAGACGMAFVMVDRDSDRAIVCAPPALERAQVPA